MLPAAIWRTITDEELLSELCRRLPHLTDESCTAMEHITPHAMSLAQKWRERMNPERAQRAYSGDFCHPIRRKAATQSGGSLPPIPDESCHPLGAQRRLE
jgi:hypothetical protein